MNEKPAVEKPTFGGGRTLMEKSEVFVSHLPLKPNHRERQRLCTALETSLDLILLELSAQRLSHWTSACASRTRYWELGNSSCFLLCLGPHGFAMRCGNFPSRLCGSDFSRNPGGHCHVVGCDFILRWPEGLLGHISYIQECS